MTINHFFLFCILHMPTMLITPCFPLHTFPASAPPSSLNTHCRCVLMSCSRLAFVLVWSQPISKGLAWQSYTPFLPLVFRLGVWPWPSWSLDVDLFSRWGNRAKWEQQAWAPSWRQELFQLGLVDAGTMPFITESQWQDVTTKGASSLSGPVCSHQLACIRESCSNSEMRGTSLKGTPHHVSRTCYFRSSATHHAPAIV